MITRVPSIRQLLLPLGFTLLCVVLAIGVWQAFGGRTPLQAEGYRFTVRIPQAESLFENTPVLTSGVEVGRIVRVTQRGRGAELEIELEARFAPVRRDARVMARTKTLLGEGYLELSPGPPSAPPVPEGGTLAASRATPTQRLDDVLATFDPTTRSQFRALMDGTSRAFDGRAQDLNDALGRLPGATADLGTLVDALVAQEEPLERFIAGGAELLGALGQRQAALTGAISQSRRVLRVTADRRAGLRSTIEALPPFLTSLRSASASIEDAAPDVRRAVAALRPTAAALPPALAAVDRNGPRFRRTFELLPGTVDAVRGALPTVDAIVDAAGPALEPVHLAVRQLLPAARLAAGSRRDIVGAIANSSNIANGRIIGQGGQYNGVAAGWLTVWNEIVGGWTKKLPSNRPNPYFAPGGSGKIAKGGLEAYDCRHTGNPAILPAIGEPPPCKTQQPWALNGRTLSYPRLLLDPP